jgi:hypothetical protein
MLMRICSKTISKANMQTGLSALEIDISRGIPRLFKKKGEKKEKEKKIS